MRFDDRVDAGRRLAMLLRPLRPARPVVMGLPRGGVPVAYEVARELGAPLDVVVVRKLGAPSQPELAIGAVGEDGVRVLNDSLVDAVGLRPGELDEITRRESAEVARRVRRFRGERAAVAVEGRTVILVDDGIATGATARAAAEVLRARHAGRVVLAVPVATPAAVDQLREVCDEVVCVVTPDHLWAVGQWYEDFTQVDDAEVQQLLARAVHAGETAHREVEVAPGLAGSLAIPVDAVGMVVFAHGSGSSRTSPRNAAVAATLNRAELATLLFDLLTEDEARDRANVFDIPLLAGRLEQAVKWLQVDTDTRRLPLGCFGASTGAAAALWAAADLGAEVGAVVSRGGRPDLAMTRLEAVRSPTLLVVGSFDTEVLALNRDAQRHLRCENDLVVVPGATHLFEEPGTLDRVADLAAAWFRRHLGGAGAGGRDDRHHS